MSDSLFEQAFDEVCHDIASHDGFPESFTRWRVIDRLRDPDRVISFTVRWVADDGTVQHTPAWRVQHCNVLGPYKGGLRFAPDVNEDTLRFLAFEQCLKNALTGLPLGGGKGGARFRTRDHSETEVMSFCQAFADEYVRYGGEDTDVPAGDIGTGEREIGWIFGRLAKLTGRHTGTVTGKPTALGGIAGRSEATGYGAVIFAKLMCERHDIGFEGRRVAISGAGNVALHAAERCVEEGAKVLTLSNSTGTARFNDGLSKAHVDEIKRCTHSGERLEDMAGNVDWMSFDEGATPWDSEADIAMPCATQNELDTNAAELLISRGLKVVSEGANMPCTSGATAALREAGVLVGPGKAANAGGVAVSGFEMIQNATHNPWSRKRVLDGLDQVMREIHERCVAHGGGGERVDYIRGANLAGYERLAKGIVAAGPN